MQSKNISSGLINDNLHNFKKSENHVSALKFLIISLLVAWGLFTTLARAQAPVQPQNLEARLFQAVYSPDQTKAIALIEAGADVNALGRNAINSQVTILHHATEQGRRQVVEALVRKGAKVNAEVEGFRGIPLTIALANGYEDIARFLINYGANAKYIDSAGYTMLHVAAGRVSNAMLELLIDKGCNIDGSGQRADKPLYWAIRRQRWDNAKFLVQKGADIHNEIGEGLAPLSMAAKYGGLELAQLLVAKGAKVRERNAYSGRTALHEAALYGHNDIAAFLIDQGADINANGVPKDSRYGKLVGTPILGPTYRGHFETVKLLTVRGADLNSRGDRGQTPLGMAAFGGHRDIVEWLVRKGAEINPFDKDCELEAHLMPLLSAVDRGDIAMVRFLLSKGAKVNAKAKGGETALRIAQRFQRSDIADLLIIHGATE